MREYALINTIVYLLLELAPIWDGMMEVAIAKVELCKIMKVILIVIEY
jgi:hypothetical protein